MRFRPSRKCQLPAALVGFLVLAGCSARQSTREWPLFHSQASNTVLPKSSSTIGPAVGAATKSSSVPKDLLFGNLEDSHPEFSFDHPRVEDFVKLFRTRNHDYFERALERSSKYLPEMTNIMKEEGLPPELAYLPFIESGFRTRAVSSAGAVGPWQFIRSTGRRYGLRIDRYVDERRDPIKSTRAAAHYLRDLYDMFGSWHLSLAAYNTGEDRIARIKAKRGVDTYWEMMEKGYLHPETRDYVPQFLAALEIARAPEEHGFQDPGENPLHYDILQVHRSVSLRRLAKLAGASGREMADLNPALTRGITPPGSRDYNVRVPSGTKAKFALAYAQVLREPRPALATYAQTNRYRIRRGDTPSGIAARFGVSVRALMRANGWKDASRIRAGHVARIPGSAAHGRPVALAKATSARRRTRKASHAVTYRIRKGDTPTAIASQFGVSVGDLMQHNGWEDARGLQPGDLARIPRETNGSTAGNDQDTPMITVTYRVRKGDTPVSIARRFGVSANDVMTANGWTNPRRIKPGMMARIPVSEENALRVASRQ